MTRFSKAVWIYLAYLFAVIAFGAWVRISESGAGCGSHWPLCNGDVIPVAASVKTLTEFTHRLTSGLCGPISIGLGIWAWRLGNKWVFRAALASLFFVLMEGFVGAVLVKKELVVNDASASRAVVIALHLGNTLLLTASTAAMALWATPRMTAARSRWVVGVLVLVALSSMTGAVTALGDTLFPRQPALSGDLFAEVARDLSATHHFLVRLRVMHPVVAMVSAAAIGAFLFLLPGTRWVQVARALLGLQVLLGFLNVALAARNVDKLSGLAAGTGAKVFACDASKEEQMSALFEAVETSIGAPDVAIYNASFRTRGPFVDLVPSDVEKAIAITTFGVVNALALRPAAVPDGSDLLVVAASRPTSKTLRYLSYPNFVDLRARASAFRDLVAYAIDHPGIVA